MSSVFSPFFRLYRYFRAFWAESGDLRKLRNDVVQSLLLYAGLLLAAKRKSFFRGDNFLFQGLKLMFQALELMFRDVELIFQALEQKILLSVGTFPPCVETFSLSWAEFVK